VRSEDCGFTYYSRWYRGPELPVTLGPPVQPQGTFTLLTLPGDGDTWSLTVWAPSADAAMRALRDPDRFDRLVAACPLAAHWLAGEPTSAVLPMAGVLDRHRRFVVDGRPVATGVAAVGDAWACTNPSAGKGLTVGLIHAQRLRDVVRHHGLDDPEALAHCWDEVTEAEVAPYVHDQIRADRARLAEMDALRRGDRPPPRDAADEALTAATQAGDPDAFAALLDLATCQAPRATVLAREELAPCLTAGATAEDPPGPTRRELLDLLA
jgi:2-polyprenyl-6-methoxyphenol hydroxylase-like FAD-dependent oxidoreductase